jgi:hypothetical protein
MPKAGELSGSKSAPAGVTTDFARNGERRKAKQQKQQSQNWQKADVGKTINGEMKRGKKRRTEKGKKRRTEKGKKRRTERGEKTLNGTGKTNTHKKTKQNKTKQNKQKQNKQNKKNKQTNTNTKIEPLGQALAIHGKNC